VDVGGDLERAFAAAMYPNRGLVAVGGIGVLLALAIVARRWRWDRPVRRHPWAGIVGLTLVLALALPLGWYLGSPLFTSTTIDEPPPVAAVEPIASPAPPAPSNGPTPSFSKSPATPSPAPSATPVPPIERSGTFTGADEFHFGRGMARLIETSPGKYTLRLERFAVRNGPDLHVYLSPVANGHDEGAIELGRLKADRGNQNYAVPGGVDVAGAASVVIWCKQFSVLFATAPLSP
jgi:hypothetical protein